MSYVEQMNNEDILKLTDELKQAADAYYQGNNTTMSDEEYDAKIEHLEQQLELIDQDENKEATDDVIEAIEKVLYTVSAGSEPKGNIVIHDYPMLSLAKADDEDSLKRYHTRLVNGGAKGFSIQAKLDGLALSAKYVDGELTQLATRGDGVKGESLSHLINHKEVDIVGLPINIDNKENLEVRGELYITNSQFVEINKARSSVTGENFAHSRNAAVGITKRSMSGLGYNAELSFTAYSAHKDGKQIAFDEIDGEISRVDKLTLNEVEANSKLKSCKIESVSFDDLKKLVDEIGVAREKFNIPTDGIVIKPTNDLEMLDKMGYTSRFPIAYIAYKYPGEKATTVIEEITVTVGKTGRLTPQARVKPVTIDGVTITNVTCHNYSWLNEMGIRVGSTVAITRANDVIPAIDVVIDKGPNDSIKPPKSCPECDGDLLSDGTEFPKTLSCGSSTCPSKLLHYMKSVVGRAYLYIEGLGHVAIEALVREGVLTSAVDLFKLTEDELAKIPTGETSTGNVRMLGAGNAKNIMKSVERAKENTDSNKLLASLNIDGVGPGTAKRLIDHFGGIKDVLEVDVDRLSEVNQVGSTLIESFRKHQNRALSELNELIELGVKINDPEKKGNVEYKGTFSVSGSVNGFANRNEFVEHMEKLGWEFHKSPKKTTDVLFADPNGTSSKIKKARDNGTKIINDLANL